jgi:hypothetical protein
MSSCARPMAAGSARSAGWPCSTRWPLPGAGAGPAGTVVVSAAVDRHRPLGAGPVAGQPSGRRPVRTPAGPVGAGGAGQAAGPSRLPARIAGWRPAWRPSCASGISRSGASIWAPAAARLRRGLRSRTTPASWACAWPGDAGFQAVERPEALGPGRAAWPLCPPQHWCNWIFGGSDMVRIRSGRIAWGPAPARRGWALVEWLVGLAIGLWLSAAALEFFCWRGGRVRAKPAAAAELAGPPCHGRDRPAAAPWPARPRCGRLMRPSLRPSRRWCFPTVWTPTARGRRRPRRCGVRRAGPPDPTCSS